MSAGSCPGYGGWCDRWAAGQQPLKGVLQFRARIDAELLGEDAPGVVVAGHCVGLPAGPVQAHHVLHMQRLPKRVIRDERSQFWDELVVPAAAHVGIDASLQRRGVQLGQAGTFPVQQDR